MQAWNRLAQRTGFVPGPGFLGILVGVGMLASGPPPWAQVAERSLTLQDCVRMALESNLDLQVSRINPRIAETEVTRQQSTFDPSLNSNTFYQQEEIPVFPASFRVDFQDRRSETLTWSDRLQTGQSYRIDFRESRFFLTFDPAGSSGPIYSSSFFVEFTQPLLKGRGRDIGRTQIQVARRDLGISDSDFRQSVLDTLKSVEQAYWELVFARRDLDVRNQSMMRAQRFLEENRVKVGVGTLAPIEITTAEAEVASRREGVIVGENAVEDAEDALRVLITSMENPIWDEKIVPADRPPFPEVKIDLEGNIQTAFEKRPDLERQRLTIEREDLNLNYQGNQRKHQLDVVGRYGAQGQIDSSSELAPGVPNPQDAEGHRESLEQVGRTDFDTWSLALNWGLPVGNRQAKSQYAATRLRREQALVNYELLKQRAMQEVRRAARQIGTDRQRVEAARVTVRLQREKMEAEEKKYENGMSTSFQVLEFQEDLAEAERSEVRAVVDYNISLAELDRVTGTLAETRGVVVE